MAHGRISIVLGVQQGLSTVVQICDSAKLGRFRIGASAFQASVSTRSRYNDSELYSILSQVAQLDRSLKEQGIEVFWSCLGANPKSELSALFMSLDIKAEAHQAISLEAVQSLDADALIFVPLDVHPSRQVEQLARLSMVAPRVKHVAIAPSPKWSHSQLMALRETWRWVDPTAHGKVNVYCEEIIEANGGITQKDIRKLESSFVKSEPVVEPSIITRSARMNDLLRMVDTVADTDSTILISGESGVGKELIAQRIHAKSHRRDNALIAVNCGAIPGELLESELFGHMKGAFTGAVSNREGRFEAAEAGTLFLDEVGEMGASLQVKLLRVLQSRKYEPVGATKSRDADVRIVTATNRDLEEEVKKGNFREDLFYRLNVIPVHIPALRERPEDIELLVTHFVRRFNHEKSRNVTGVTRAALRALAAYAWPGNVRELENLMERMVILKSSGMIDVLDFPEKYRRVSLSEIEYEDMMRSALRPEVVLQPQIQKQVSSVRETQSMPRGEDQTMKTFGYHNQNSQQFNGESQGSVPAQGASSGEMITIEGQGNLNIEQILHFIADNFVFPNEGLDFNSVVDQFENILILMALERTGWNRNRAAQLLRLNRTTLVEKLKKKQLTPPLGSRAAMEGNA
ncbi:MAG TPA: sigma-54 dependent transcriptional regulator [Bdellovibrionota bacterium]|nr:sigma-54 dependent transcriptional regulator [Bdellovibrionota bacterium]